jgi:hypothetical protein
MMVVQPYMGTRAAGIIPDESWIWCGGGADKKMFFVLGLTD